MWAARAARRAGAYAAMAFDENRGVLVLFGGRTSARALGRRTCGNGIPGRGCGPRSPGPDSGIWPPTLERPDMAFDPSRSRIVLVGADRSHGGHEPPGLGMGRNGLDRRHVRASGRLHRSRRFPHASCSTRRAPACWRSELNSTCHAGARACGCGNGARPKASGRCFRSIRSPSPQRRSSRHEPGYVAYDPRHDRIVSSGA